MKAEFVLRWVRDKMILKVYERGRVGRALGLMCCCGLNNVLAEPAFEGVVIDSSGAAFIVSEVVDIAGNEKIVSPFIRIKGEFRGWTLVKYIQEEEMLVVENRAGLSRVLRLRSAKINRATEVSNDRTDLSKIFGMELAKELAKRGDPRLKGKLDALEKMFGLEADQLDAIERLTGLFERLEKKYSDNEESRAKIRMHNEGIANLKKSYIKMIETHVALGRQIENEANNKVHGTPL